MNKITSPAPRKVKSLAVRVVPPPLAVQSAHNGVATGAIRTRAYELYLDRNGNGTPGTDVSDWLQAERELTNGVSKPVAPSNTAALPSGT